MTQEIKMTQTLKNILGWIVREGGSVPASEVTGSVKGIVGRLVKVGLVEVANGQYRPTEAGWSAPRD